MTDTNSGTPVVVWNSLDSPASEQYKPLPSPSHTINYSPDFKSLLRVVKVPVSRFTTVLRTEDRVFPLKRLRTMSVLIHHPILTCYIFILIVN